MSPGCWLNAVMLFYGHTRCSLPRQASVNNEQTRPEKQNGSERIKCFLKTSKMKRKCFHFQARGWLQLRGEGEQKDESEHRGEGGKVMPER